jgi:hypothetical protein
MQESLCPRRSTFDAEPVVFTLKDNKLSCVEWYLNRFMVEDKTFMPKAAAVAEGRARGTKR